MTLRITKHSLQNLVKPCRNLIYKQFHSTFRLQAKTFSSNIDRNNMNINISQQKKESSEVT